MSLREERVLFTQDVQRLLYYIVHYGYSCNIGEVMRTIEQQKLYLAQGKSKTIHSMHINGCAIDLNIFNKDNVLLTNSSDNWDAVLPIGQYWESLDTHNRWGGTWRQQARENVKFIDMPHFERYVGMT